MTSTEFMDKKDCPPKLDVKLEGKKNEWQNRAKSFNAKSFEEHKSDISDVKKAADTFIAQSTLENITLNADDKALLKYMRTLSVDKPVDISIMQTMLRDVCDKTIAIDGRMGEQTVSAMKLAMEKFKSKIPGYQEGIAVGVKIDAVMAPIIDIPSVKMPAKPALRNEGSSTDSTRLISEWSKKLDNLYPLLKQHYPDMDVVLDDHGEMFLSGKDKKTWQVIATIDTSKKEDVIWDNIRVALEGVAAKQNQKPENTVGINPVTKPETNIPSPEELKKSEWQQVQLGVALYAQSKGCEVQFAKTEKFTKGAPTLNQIYEMKILKDGKLIGSKEFTLGKDNLSDKINPDLAKMLNGYVDSTLVVPDSTDGMETQEQIDKAWYDGFDQASKYAQEKGYTLTNKATGFIAKSFGNSRPNINKIELQNLAVVDTKRKEVREIGTILPATSNIGRMKTSQEITNEIRGLIEISLSKKQEKIETTGEITILPSAIQAFQKLGIILRKQSNNEMSLQPGLGRIYEIESNGKKGRLDSKDTLDTKTESVDYIASKDEFIIKNRDGTTQIFKIREVMPEPRNTLSEEGKRYYEQLRQAKENLVDTSSFMSQTGDEYLKGFADGKLLTRQEGTNQEKTKNPPTTARYTLHIDGKDWTITESIWYKDQHKNGLAINSNLGQIILWSPDKKTQVAIDTKKVFSENQIQVENLRSELSRAETHRESEKKDPANVAQFDLPKDRPIGYISIIQKAKDTIVDGMKTGDLKFFPELLKSQGYQIDYTNAFIEINENQNVETVVRQQIEAARQKGMKDIYLNLSGHGSKNATYFGDQPLSRSIIIKIINENPDMNFYINTIACHGGGLEEIQPQEIQTNGRTVHIFTQTKDAGSNQEGRVANGTDTPTVQSTYYNIYFQLALREGKTYGQAHQIADEQSKIRSGSDATVLKFEGNQMGVTKGVATRGIGPK